MKNALILFLSLNFYVTATLAGTKCGTDADTLYAKFKEYREQLNQSSNIEPLSKFYSGNFNLYFTDKMNSAKSEIIRQQYLNQYWDNLNTANDIVIVFDYSTQCTDNQVSLLLVTILDNTNVVEGQEIELWNVAVNYVKDKDGWKIDSITYEKRANSQKYLASEIKSNFLKIR